MKGLLVLGAGLLLVFSGYAAPTEDAPVADCKLCCKACKPATVPEETPKSVSGAAPSVPATGPDGYRKETLETISKKASKSNTETEKKEKKKVKVKHLKNGNTVTTIKDDIRSKTKSDELTDAYSQINHFVAQGGIEDTKSLTTEQQHRLHEVDVRKKKEEERIVTDKYGHVISDTVKVKEKDKVKKKEKDKKKKKLVHTVKSVATGASPDSTPVKEMGEPAPAC